MSLECILSAGPLLCAPHSELLSRVRGKKRRERKRGGERRGGEGRKRKLVFNAAVSFLQDKTHII